MVATGSEVNLVDNSGSPVGEVAAFAALFRSTGGSVLDPQPYVQDTLADASITTEGSVKVLRQPDGSFAGRLP